MADYGGTFTAIGWGGGITGRKCHLIVIDDMIKNDEEALSKRIRDKMWSFLEMTVLQRVQDNRELRIKLITIATRWHDEDPIGRFLEQEHAGGPMKWKKLILPALAEHNDVLIDGTPYMRKGESLCEEIMPREYLKSVKNRVSRFTWNALYQQQPITQDGLLWEADLFDETIWVDDWPGDIDFIVVGLDPATGRALSNGDYSAIVATGIDTKAFLWCIPSRYSFSLTRFEIFLQSLTVILVWVCFPSHWPPLESPFRRFSS